MTVNTTISKRTYSGNGSATVFAWNFKLTASTQMHVYVNGADIPPGDAIYPWLISGTIPGESGDVTFTLNPPPTGTDNVILRREVTFDQQIDYQPNDPFPAETHELGLDKLTMMSQEVANDLADFDTNILSLVVTLAGTQTIPGEKTFAADLNLYKINPIFSVQCNNEVLESTVVAFLDGSGIARGLVYRPAGDNSLNINARDSVGTLKAALIAKETGKIDISVGTLQIANVDMTATAAELNTVDGSTTPGIVTLVDADGVVINDSGVMKQGRMLDIKNYITASLLNTVVLEIGAWDMTALAAKTFSHGVTQSKIRKLSAIIRRDSDISFHDFASASWAPGQTGSNSLEAQSTSIIITRGAGGFFDDTIFNDPAMLNRGWVIVEYEN